MRKAHRGSVLSEPQRSAWFSAKAEIARFCQSRRDWKVEIFLDRGFVQSDPQIRQWFEEELYDTTEAVYSGIIRSIDTFCLDLYFDEMSYADMLPIMSGLCKYALWCLDHDWW